MLDGIKKDLDWGKKVGGRPQENLDMEQVSWLIEQAEILERLRRENKIIENASEIIGEGFLAINPQDLTSICLKCRIDLSRCVCK